MRHFEFTDTQSSKFWRIEQDGHTLTLNWGRIGSAGQSQIKEFASAEQTAAEMAKLVKGKLGKGYVEVLPTGNETAATPAPKAETKAEPSAETLVAAAAPEPDAGHGATVLIENQIRWPPETRALILPCRKRPAPTRTYDAATEWAGVMAQAPRDIYAGDIDPDLRADFAAAGLRWQPPHALPPITEAALEAATFHLCATPDSAAHLVRFWLATGGLVRALQCLLAVMHIRRFRRRDEVWQWVTRLPEASDHWNDFYMGYAFDGGMAPWFEMREALSCAPEPVWREAQACVDAAMGSLTPHSRIAFCFLFPDKKAWIQEAMGKLGTRYPAAPTLINLLSCLDDGAQAEALAKLSFLELDCDARVLSTLLARVGPDAAPALETLFLAQAHQSQFSHLTKNKVLGPLLATQLARIGSMQAIEILVRCSEHPPMLTALRQSLSYWPELGLGTLAQGAARPGKPGQTSQRLLAGWLRAEGAALDPVIATLPEALRRSVDKERAKIVEAADAEPDEWPAVLAAPPWRGRGKKKARAMPALALAPLLPAREAWPQGLRESWTAAFSWDKAVEPMHFQTPKQALKNLHLGGHPLGEHLVKNGGLDEAELAALLAAFDRHRGSCEAWERDRCWDPVCFGYLPGPVALAFWNDPLASYVPTGWTGPEQAFVARFGVSALPGLLRMAERDALRALHLLRPLAAPAAAPLAARVLALQKKARPEAIRWLLAHPAEAIDGLLPAALGQAGAERAQAEQALRWLAQQGHEALLRETALRHSQAAAEAAEALLAFDPLLLYPDKLPRLPDFVAPETLPRPLLRSNGKALPLPAVADVVLMLAFSKLDAPYAGLKQVQAACTPASLAALAWELFMAWLHAGAVPKEQWAFLALGHLGDDDCARRIAPLVREWPGQSASARAVLGLDVLATIGTDMALTHLHGIAQKIKFKGLQAVAQEKIRQIAETRGLSPQELADRLVPGFDLDVEGALSLDFGPRRFRVRFDEMLRPWVLDADGKRLGELPKPRATDDAGLAKAATERFKALKKDVRTIASQQVTRLEQAMCTERRWTPEVFRTFLVRHPLMRYLVQRLVWGAWIDGRLQACFRVAEDGSLADRSDTTWSLPEAAEVGIVHALDLPEAERSAFGQLFGDYELLQPFEQLNRDCHALTDAERGTGELTRWERLEVPVGKVLGLENRGWQKGRVWDAGSIWDVVKELGQARVSLALHPGLIVGLLNEHPEQTLGGLSVHGVANFGELSRVAASEIIRDMQSLLG